jgi:hypothetical protein
MIYATRKNRCLVFALAARNAARRFLARGLHGAGSAAWSPLVLRWRRRAKRKNQIATSRAASQATVQWFPQFHFHFATYLRDRNRFGARGPLGSQAAPTQQTRIVVDQHWTNVTDRPASPAQPHFPRRQTTSPHARESSRTQKQGAASDVPHASKPTIKLPIVRWPRPRPGQKPFAHTPEAARAEKQSTEPSRPFQRNSRTWQHWPQVVSLRSPKTIDQVGSRAHEPQGLRVQFDRAEELVWRRKLPAKRIDEVETEPERPGSFRRSAGNSFASVEEPMNGLPQVAKAEIAPVTTLDSSVLDRLTDDVIRRVEQRIRIERERRGL